MIKLNLRPLEIIGNVGIIMIVLEAALDLKLTREKNVRKTDIRQLPKREENEAETETSEQ